MVEIALVDQETILRREHQDAECKLESAQSLASTIRKCDEVIRQSAGRSYEERLACGVQVAQACRARAEAIERLLAVLS